MEEQEIEQEIQTEEVQTESSVDHNWRQANEVLSSQKRQIEELQNQINHMNQPKVEEEVDEFADLDPDDIITVGKARKLASKEASKAARQIIQEHMHKQHIANDESRMRAKHEDYDYVLNTFALPLINNDPALAYNVQMSKNPAETAYKLGKLSDGYEAAATTGTSPRAEKILKNNSRPVSSHAVSSPLKDQADTFSKMSNADIWAQSQKYASLG